MPRVDEPFGLSGEELHEYAHAFRVATVRDLEEVLTPAHRALLMDLELSKTSAGLWATAIMELRGVPRPWEWRRLVVGEHGLAQTPDAPEDDALAFSEQLEEVLATADEWPPSDRMFTGVRAELSEDPLAAQAFPGGPKLRDLDPESLMAQMPQELAEFVMSCWNLVRPALARPFWGAPRPVVTEDGRGIHLQLTTRLRWEPRVFEISWNYAEVVARYGNSGLTTSPADFADRTIRAFGVFKKSLTIHDRSLLVNETDKAP
jgi:hypothetical protein